MRRIFLRDGVGWGFVLWLIGYALGIGLFFVVPVAAIGWIILPIGTAITIWVLIKKVNAESLRYYFSLAIVWTLIAVACDYLFLVKVLDPPDGYYKLDVYLYYAIAFTLPLIVGWLKQRSAD